LGKVKQDDRQGRYAAQAIEKNETVRTHERILLK
jgi:hypothetical protein